MACVYIQIGNITVWLPRHVMAREKKRRGHWYPGYYCSIQNGCTYIHVEVCRNVQIMDTSDYIIHMSSIVLHA